MMLGSKNIIIKKLEPIKWETELMTDEDESGIKQATKSKPLWIDLSRKDFE